MKAIGADATSWSWPEIVLAFVAGWLALTFILVCVLTAASVAAAWWVIATPLRAVNAVVGWLR